mgnify:CR=1 FL=1
MQEIFGKRLRELRISKGITQSELAKKLNVTYYAICNYERGKNYRQMILKSNYQNSLMLVLTT